MFALKNSENLNFPALLPNGLWLSTKNAGKFNFQNSHSEHPHEYSIKLGKKPNKNNKNWFSSTAWEFQAV